jgi:alkanesulfonate monooxygenase SsuD/methylene tetrahydromethanopterin reductase-like flavin-dependent oxidoreductase (luciferase family)
MKFLLMTLIAHHPDPLTGEKKSPADRLREVIDAAVLAEELGYDGFAVGERHEDPFISSSPPVVLSHIAARTSTIGLFTAVTTLSLLDPVRAFEDYSTLDNLSGGRLELIIGKGNGAAQAELFHVTTEDQWDRNREGYELFRALWESDEVTWSGKFRPSLVRAKALPRPLQERVRIWHGSATSEESVDLAARFGDPIFSANVTYPIEPYAELVRHYRHRWEFYGHRPEDALVGSPQQVIDKVSRYHEQLGHEVMHLSADADGVTVEQKRRSLQLFGSDIAPVLRDRIPSRPLVAELSRKERKEVAL